MDYPKVGIMTFGDHRGPEWDTVFSTMTIPRHAKAVELLTSLPLEVISFPEVARTRDQIDEQVDALKHAGIELFIVHTPCWTSPNLVVHGVQRMGATRSSSATGTWVPMAV